MTYAPHVVALEVKDIVLGHFNRALEIAANRIRNGTTYGDCLLRDAQSLSFSGGVNDRHCPKCGGGAAGIHCIHCGRLPAQGWPWRTDPPRRKSIKPESEKPLRLVAGSS